MTVTIDGSTGVFAPALSAGIEGTVSLDGGFVSQFDADGTFSASTTYTPALTGSNWKYIVNGGNFTLAAPATAGATLAYTMVVYIANVSAPGTITMSGFSRVTGDLFTTTVGHAFYVYITVFGTGNKIANVVAAQ